MCVSVATRLGFQLLHTDSDLVVFCRLLHELRDAASEALGCITPGHDSRLSGHRISNLVRNWLRIVDSIVEASDSLASDIRG